MLTMGGPRSGIVNNPLLWASSGGYEFSAQWGHVDPLTAAGAANRGLDAAGWLVGVNVVEGVGADFLSSSDRDPTVADVALSFITGPRIFGDYAHALQASKFLGYFPTKLVLETPIRFTSTTVATNAFTGLVAAAVVAADAAGSGGSITGVTANFMYKSDLGSITMAAVDSVWHLWRIEWRNNGVVEVYMDDVSQGTSTVETDIWPLPFHLRHAGASNGKQDSPWVRIYYA